MVRTLTARTRTWVVAMWRRYVPPPPPPPEPVGTYNDQTVYKGSPQPRRGFRSVDEALQALPPAGNTTPGTFWVAFDPERQRAREAARRAEERRERERSSDTGW